MKEEVLYKPHSGTEFYSEKLLPCPFCSGHAQLKFIGNDYSKSRKVEVKCTFCRATIVNAGIRLSSKELAIISIKSWNNRI